MGELSGLAGVVGGELSEDEEGVEKIRRGRDRVVRRVVKIVDGIIGRSNERMVSVKTKEIRAQRIN